MSIVPAWPRTDTRPLPYLGGVLLLGRLTAVNWLTQRVAEGPRLVTWSELKVRVWLITGCRCHGLIPKISTIREDAACLERIRDPAVVEGGMGSF